ncbi:MAG: class I tRNA ligase family protein [Candidatus Zixiibacteriota bacterium]
MIQVNVKCPKCGKSLMDEKHKINEHPSVKVMIEHKNKRGWVRLSSLYGSYNLESELLIPEGESVRFFCPFCESDLAGTRKCEKCDAAMIPLKFSDGGFVEICSRKGCKKHLIEFENLENELKAFYNAYPLFFKPK